jgi:branched-chain amino acid transport system substrate-binding protein
MKFKLKEFITFFSLVSVSSSFGIQNTFAQNKVGLTGDKVKIGVLTDMSGVFSDLSGTGSVYSAQMAIDDFKAKYNPSFQIELVVADHQNKPDVASAKAREWYDTQGVDMITDVINSGVAIAVSKIALDKKKVLMVTGSGSTRIHNEDCNPYTIHYGWDTRTFANAQVKALAEQGKKSWYFVSVDYALGQALEKDATEAIKESGGSVVGSVKHPLNSSDFSSFVLQAMASKAQVVAFANAGGDLINSVKAANEFGMKKNQTITGLVTSIIDVNSIGVDLTQGMYLVEDYYWDIDDSTREFGRRFFIKQKRMPNFVHAALYSSVMTYLKAVQVVKTDNAEDVIKQMKKVPINDYFTKNGKIREDNKMIHDVYFFEVKKPSEVKSPWDYYILKKKILANEVSQSLASSKCFMVTK